MKFKITMIIEREYEVTKNQLREHYGNVNFDAALEVDIKTAKDDPSMFLEYSNDSTICVKGEIIK